MQIVIGSRNPVKIQATQQAFDLFFPQITITPVTVDSGVKPFPTSQTETLQGALNRARAAQKAFPEAEYAVGIEGGVITIDVYSFVQGFTVIINGDTLGIGGSAAYEVPSSILKKIDPKKEASKHEISSLLGKSDLFQQEGVIGILTKKQLTRTMVYRDTVICALTRFLSPEQY